ncbi:MAG: cytochrome c biogenesis protein CcdA, partial [Bdellovibrionales bacterium]
MKISLTGLLVLLFCYLNVFAQNQTPDPLEVQVSLSPRELKIHQPTKLIVDMQLPPGYHAYLDQFVIRLDKSSGFQLGEWQVSPLKTWYDKFSKRDRQGVEGKSQLVAELIAPQSFDGDVLNFELDYQACSETFCLFPTTKNLQVKFEVKSLNQNSSGWPGLNLEALFKEQVKDSLLMALIISFLAGFLTSLSPCVYPMIPITVAVLSHGAEKRSRLSQFSFSAFYVLGIATTFSILGLAAAQFGFLFGSLLSHTWVLGAIALVLLTMGLSLLGLFEIRPPAKLMNVAAGRGGSGR